MTTSRLPGLTQRWALLLGFVSRPNKNRSRPSVWCCTLSFAASKPKLHRCSDPSPPSLANRREGVMSAFKAFKACVPIKWSPHLYITLVRGIPGTRRLHRRTLEALRLTKCNRTVIRNNTPSIRGMLEQVKRLIVIETDEMFKARRQKIAEHRAFRPPLVISHAPPASSSSA